MKLVSEDSVSSNIANLLKCVYGDDAYFSEGNGNIKSVVDDLLLKYPSEEIIVYLDLVPGNREVRRMFIKYLLEYKDFNNVYIVPIICAEFYILKSWFEYGIITDDSSLRDILENNSWYGTYDNNSNFKSVEKFCKYIRSLKTLDECKNGVSEEKIRYYFKENCQNCNFCPPLLDRAINYLLKLPAYLSSISIPEGKAVSYNYILDIFYSTYNAMCDNYSSADDSKIYSKIFRKD